MLIGVCSRSIESLSVRFRLSAEGNTLSAEGFMEKLNDLGVSRLSRREAIQVGAGALLGSAAVLAGGGGMARPSSPRPPARPATTPPPARPQNTKAPAFEPGPPPPPPPHPPRIE